MSPVTRGGLLARLTGVIDLRTASLDAAARRGV